MSTPDPPDPAPVAPPDEIGAGRRRWWSSPAWVSAVAGVAAVLVAAVSVVVNLPRGAANPAETTTASAAEGHHVFVYGSSMPGESRYGEIKEYVEASTRASVDGLLYDTGLGYPAAKFDPGAEIPGFLLTLNPATADAFLREQTALEAGLFIPVTVQTKSGVAATAWEWIGATDGFPRIDAWDGSTAGYGETIDARALLVGECFTNPDGRTVVTVWCDAPHGYETIVAESLPAEAYSGDQVDAATEARCRQELDALAGPDAASLETERYLPTKEAWEAGDRFVVCAAYEPGALLTGSLATYGD